MLRWNVNKVINGRFVIIGHVKIIGGMVYPTAYVNGEHWNLHPFPDSDRAGKLAREDIERVYKL